MKKKNGKFWKNGSQLNDKWLIRCTGINRILYIYLIELIQNRVFLKKAVSKNSQLNSEHFKYIKMKDLILMQWQKKKRFDDV